MLGKGKELKRETEENSRYDQQGWGSAGISEELGTAYEMLFDLTEDGELLLFFQERKDHLCVKKEAETLRLVCDLRSRTASSEIIDPGEGG